MSAGSDHPARLRLLATLALYGALIALYAPSLSAPLSGLDDQSQLRHAAALAGYVERDVFGHFRPAKNLLFALVVYVGEDLAPVRAGLLALFLGTVALVQRYAGRVTRSPMLGLGAALCWSLHPVNASVVAWLSGAHVLLCTAAVLVYVSCGVALLRCEAARPRAALHAGALCALGVALSAHQLALLAPVALLLHARLLVQEARPRALRWLHVGSIACIALYGLLHLALTPTTVSYRFASTPAWLLMFSSARYFLENALLWWWPFGSFGVLATDQPAQRMLGSAIAWLFVLLALVLARRLRRLERPATFGSVWFALFLAPACNLVPLGVTPIAMHYLPLPAVGGAIALATLAGRAWSRLTAAPPLRVTAAGAALLMAGMVARETASAVAAWGDDVLLYQRSLARDGDNVEVLVNLSAVYLDRGEHAKAGEVLARARALAPDDRSVLHNQIALLWEAEAPRDVLALIASRPELANDGDILVHKGLALARLGRDGEAAQVFARVYTESADPALRFQAGYQLVITLLRTGEGARARTLVDELSHEYPGREELAIARALL